VRFIIGGSIEDRMLDIQERKNQLGEALNISDEERRRRKVAELQSLLKE
jgi:DNA repair protein RAD5